MLLRLGDKVVIKEDLRHSDLYQDVLYVSLEMSKLKGKEACITRVDTSREVTLVELDIDQGKHLWSIGMFSSIRDIPSEEITEELSKDDDKPSELTLEMLLSKLTEDYSINIDISFEDAATRIVSENYYSWQLEPYYNRVVKWYAPDFDNGELAILLEGEF